ncbi:hypothetical protein KAI04_03435 [Candidatus Pacearchaeota archaeon]|nr:hypothetical protein [Candidatus Pacearchaeota archaeon]
MSKEKSRETTKIYNKKHSIPKCMVPFLDALEFIKYVERIGLGSYRKIKSNESTLDLKGYDELKHSYKVIIRHNHFQQEFILSVNKDKKDIFKKVLENYLGD